VLSLPDADYNKMGSRVLRVATHRFSGGSGEKDDETVP
jgi:hypothetical protein